MAYAAAKLAVSYFNSYPIRDYLFKRDMESIAKDLSLLPPLLLKYTRKEGNKLRLDPLEEQIEDALDRFTDLYVTRISSDQSGATIPKDGDNDFGLVSLEELQEIRQEISSLAEELRNELELYIREEKNKQKPAGQSFAADDIDSSRIYCPSGQDCSKPVGLDDEVRYLIDRIMGNFDDHVMMTAITIVGMAGIGKTTLAQQVYDHPSISAHFDTRIMLTTGPNFNFRKFLLLMLHHTCNDSVERLQKLKDEALEIRLRDFLNGRKYLIVVDDIWNAEIFSNLHRLLVCDMSQSQIIFTTRRSDILPYNNSYVKRFLDDENSWDLLKGTVFTSPEERCSHRLEMIGKQIAKNCEGLPLAIVLVGKRLCQNEKTVEYWKKVSEDDNPLNIGIDDNTEISRSLYLSYKMLPRIIKACFLYVGVFPKSYKISNFNLIRLWLAEGFLTPEPGVLIEDVAQGILSELASQSVVLVHEWSSMGHIKTCRVHTVFRSLCIGVAQKQEFCLVMKKYAYSFPRFTNRQPRLCIHNNVILSIKEVRSTLESISSILSLLCFGSQHLYPLHVNFSFKLLRTLDALRIHFYEFPEQVLELVRLRYLALTYDGQLPNSISKLWKLQVLIVSRHHLIKSSDPPLYLPVEIWHLKWLRHLQCMGADLLDHSTSYKEGCDEYPILRHWITLLGVSPRSCTQRILARMPKLKKLGIQIQLAPDEVENFSFLRDVAQQLRRPQSFRSFKCIVLGTNSQITPTFPVFPRRALKITLSGCRFPWACMLTAIGSLPALKVLKLRCHAFQGSVWELHEVEFCSLKYLLLEDLDVEDWRPRHHHFPNLEHLIIKHCYKLREIPVVFGNIKTLKMIKVEDCNPSVGTSAERIHAYTNGRVSVDISFSYDE